MIFYIFNWTFWYVVQITAKYRCSTSSMLADSTDPYQWYCIKPVFRKYSHCFKCFTSKAWWYVASFENKTTRTFPLRLRITESQISGARDRAAYKLIFRLGHLEVVCYLTSIWSHFSNLTPTYLCWLGQGCR